MWALDIYGNEYEVLTEVYPIFSSFSSYSQVYFYQLRYQALQSFNEENTPILIQECYLNDVETFDNIKQAALEYSIYKCQIVVDLI